jgi:hypothetical protein
VELCYDLPPLEPSTHTIHVGGRFVLLLGDAPVKSYGLGRGRLISSDDLVVLSILEMFVSYASWGRS